MLLAVLTLGVSLGSRDPVTHAVSMARRRPSTLLDRAPQQRRLRPRSTGTATTGLGAEVLRAVSRAVAGSVDREDAEQVASSVLGLAPPGAPLGWQRSAARDVLVQEVLGAARSSPPSRSVARALSALRLLLGDEHPVAAELDALLVGLPRTCWRAAAPLRLHRLVRMTELRGDVRATYAVVDAEDLPPRVLGVLTDVNLGHASGLLYVTLDGLAALETMSAEEPGAQCHEVTDPGERARVVAETLHDLRELREQPVAWRCLSDSEREQQSLLERRWADLGVLVDASEVRGPTGPRHGRAGVRAEFLFSAEAADLAADVAELAADVMLDVDERWDTGWGRLSARKLSLLPERLLELRGWHAEDLPDGFLSALRAWIRWCARRAGLLVEEQLLVLAAVEALEQQWDDPDELLDLLWGSGPDATPPPALALRQAG